MIRTILTLLVMALAASAAAQGSGVPSLNLSDAEMPGAPAGGAWLMVRPDGTGPAFAGSRGPAGELVDATVVLTLVDFYGDPITHFPAEDVWLAPAAPLGTYAACSCEFVCQVFPEGMSDAAGHMYWTLPPRAGGWTDGLMQVFVNGSALTSSAGLDLRFSSPDINGDLVVDLSDAGFFTGHLLGGVYHSRADLVHDQVINLSDAGAFATSLSADCP